MESIDSPKNYPYLVSTFVVSGILMVAAIIFLLTREPADALLGIVFAVMGLVVGLLGFFFFIRKKT